MSSNPPNPAFADAVRESFARQGLMAALGARLVDVEPSRVVIELPYSDAVSQQRGLFHGAAIGAIADTAAGYAAMTLMPAGSEVLTVEYKINLMRAAAGELLRSVGQVARAGRSLTVARAEVLCGDGTEMAPCAMLQATLMRIDAG